MKTPTTLPITDLRAFYNTKTDVFLFLDSSFSHYLITSDGDEFVALQQGTEGGADFAVYEIARASHIFACNEACMRGVYFDLNHHLDAETDVAPKFIAD
jgi:hypothetical protein